MHNRSEVDFDFSLERCCYCRIYSVVVNPQYNQYFRVVAASNSQCSFADFSVIVLSATRPQYPGERVANLVDNFLGQVASSNSSLVFDSMAAKVFYLNEGKSVIVVEYCCEVYSLCPLKTHHPVLVRYVAVPANHAYDIELKLYGSLLEFDDGHSLDSTNTIVVREKLATNRVGRKIV